MAEAELEYDKNHKSPSLYIRFKLSTVSDALKKYDEFGDLYALIWTTTPWTLPANQAICFNPSLQYSIVRLNEEAEYYIVGTEMLPKLRETLEFMEFEEVASLSGSDLEHCTYIHPMHKEMVLPFLKGSHVTSDVGTGLVHTAPAHGFDDYLVCLSAKIPIVSEYYELFLLKRLNSIHFEHSISRNASSTINAIIIKTHRRFYKVKM